jgi:radical SAM superfamily enzyme YgiQ (UPF0313 family)
LRVLLVSPNREMLPDPVFPLGVAYVAAALEGAGHHVQVTDLCFVDDIDAALETAVAESDPDLVGISARNVDDVAYPRTTSYLAAYQSTVAAIRRHTRAPIVVGGSAFTIMPAEFLEALDVDYGVVGEGEAAAVELVSWLEHGRIRTPPASVATRRSPDAAARRDPDWSVVRPARGHFDSREYYARGGMLNVQTRRGCPFRCIYCSYPHIEGRTVRLRPASEAVDEIQEVVASTGAKHFFVVDSVFNHPRDHALAFCDELIRRDVGIGWSCYANPGHMDGALVERMVRAGCTSVEFGTDSLVDEVLASLDKGFTFADVAEASRLCRESGLRYCHFVFVGSPGEGPDDVALGMDRLASLDADASVIMAGLRILPGTRLADRARSELGISRVGLDPVYYISPALVGRIEAIADQIVRQHPSWVMPGFRRNFDERIQRLVRRAGKKGALWEALPRR